MATLVYFSVRDVTIRSLCRGVIVTVITDVPCHLWMRWTTVPAQVHSVPTYKRGIYLHGNPYFCMVGYKDNEQEEADDTLIHTFLKPAWEVCETRFYYFWGEIAGEVSPSTSSTFEFHYDITHHIFPSEPDNRTIYNTHAVYAIAHDSADGIIGPWHDPPWVRLRAAEILTVSFWFYRTYLTFDTSSFPSDKELAGAMLRIYPWQKNRTSSVANPHLCITQGVQHSPVIPSDYGDQLPETTIGGKIDFDDLVLNEYNEIELNQDGLGFINKDGITKLCLRGEQDILSIPPPLGENGTTIWSNQADSALRPYLVLCRVPD